MKNLLMDRIDREIWFGVNKQSRYHKNPSIPAHLCKNLSKIQCYNNGLLLSEIIKRHLPQHKQVTSMDKSSQISLLPQKINVCYVYKHNAVTESHGCESDESKQHWYFAAVHEIGSLSPYITSSPLTWCESSQGSLDQIHNLVKCKASNIWGVHEHQ